jgi:chemotaxis protein MotB
MGICGQRVDDNNWGTKPMTNPAKHRLIVVSLLSTTFLTGCVVWKSDYDKVQSQNQQLQQQVATDQQQISRLQAAIKYTVNSDLLFAPGSWQMRPQGQQVIANLAKKLAPTQQNHLIVSGYTDNAPIGPTLRQEGVTSNQDLSQKRADAVKQYLISQGVKPDLVSAQGFGDASPVASNDTAQGRGQNRRVELSLGGASS